MEVITIDSEAYRELMAKINFIEKFIRTLDTKISFENGEKNPDELWVDSYEVCTFLRISARTLQRLRSNRIISYSIIAGKTYYTIAEIKRVLAERKIRTSDEYINDLINNHRSYAEQRRNIKKNA